MFGITQITDKHDKRVAGFIIRLGWCDGRASLSMEFSNKKYGGHKQALEKAISCRNEQLSKLKQEGKWPVERILRDFIRIKLPAFKATSQY